MEELTFEFNLSHVLLALVLFFVGVHDDGEELDLVVGEQVPVVLFVGLRLFCDERVGCREQVDVEGVLVGQALQVNVLPDSLQIADVATEQGLVGIGLQFILLDCADQRGLDQAESLVFDTLDFAHGDDFALEGGSGGTGGLLRSDALIQLVKLEHTAFLALRQRSAGSKLELGLQLVAQGIVAGVGTKRLDGCCV